MNTDNWLERLLTLQVGDETHALIQQIAHNYELYRLAGYSKIALALFLLRSYNDIQAALEKNGYPIVKEQERK